MSSQKNHIDEYKLNNRPVVRPSSARLRFNICGEGYEILESTLQNFPETPLAKDEWRAKFWDDTRGEYYLDRNRECFRAILTYYQSEGILCSPENVPEKLFFQELEFYGLREPRTKPGRILPKNSIQKEIWELFEYPDTSKYAKAIAWLSCTVVLLSIVMFCVETLPKFTKESEDSKTDVDDPFYIIEAVCISWFTFEYIVRFISSPIKTKFVVGALNLIDLIAILPFFISFALQSSSNVSSLALLRALRLVRVFRIFKLSRYSKGLRILGLTMKASMAELGLLAFFLTVGIVLFSSAIYYAEMDENGEVFRSIPHAFWWAIVTMTTVGYGDMYPVTFAGKIIGSICAFTGILSIALPVPVIVANFEHHYNNANSELEDKLNVDTSSSKYDRVRKFFKSIRRKKEQNHTLQPV
ncbi:potassium voltage-gated channel subfamily A member 2-like [Dendronephthya gigantea]|uniref:potassium voltage-gated channel subfamily A member 2-like n=1 Tax=Dendronephthya gigantea TaxID=151771 RepID=UPI00106D5B01|nr:potassium voltage-gated channel subfamily A member 2-like [Dendronephthya gigantea]